MPTDAPILVPASAVAAQAGELVVRASWRWPAVAFAVLAPLAAAALVAPWALADEPPHWAAVAASLWVGLWLALFASHFWRALRCARGPGGWTLRASPDRLLVNLRSYLNADLPGDDPVVLVLPRRCVKWLRAVEVFGKRAHRDEDGVVHENPIRRSYLDIAVDGDLAAAGAELAREAQRRRPGLIGSSRYMHGSAALRGADVVRIFWRDESNRLTPGLAEARSTLARWHRFAEDDSASEPALAALSSAERETRLLEMVERGEEVQAIGLARELYGYDTTTAVQFVRELRARPHPGGP